MPARTPGRPGLPAVLLLSLAACSGYETVSTETSFGSHDTEPPPPPDTSGPDSTSGAVPTTTEPVATTDVSTTSGDDTTTGASTGDTDATTGAPVDLCAHLGGMDPSAGIPAIVDDFLQRVLQDDRVNGYFLNSDLDAPALSACLGAQLGALAECPGVTYDCQDMKTAHTGLGVSTQDNADFLELLGAALTAARATRPDLTDADNATILAALLELAPDIVEDEASDATLYQRLGRNKNLRKLVGTELKSGTFLGIVGEDEAINGFFLGTDFTRLATCLTRQLAGIDGPVVYGAEVTAPPGVQDGVSQGDPCKDMMSVHTGLKDDLLTPITIDDFMALLADLGAALENFNASQPDREAVLAAYSAMCPDIVVAVNDCPGHNTTVTIEAKDLALDLKPVDGLYNGTLGSMACVDLEVPDDGINYLEDVRLTVAMDHTWLGDVTIKILSPDDKILTALARTGDPMGALPDSSDGCCGDDSNFAAAAPFTLRDGAPFKGADIGKGIANNAVACKDEMPKHVPCDWTPFPGMGPGTGFADFAGKNAAGTWTVCFGDSNVGDLGAVSSVALTLDKVMDPP